MSVAWQFYISTVLVYLGVDVMACWGLNLQFGVAGLVNFAFIIFQAAGAYTAAVLTLGVVCTALAFLIFFALIGEIGPVRATVITYVNPAVAVTLGVLLLHERLTGGIAVGFVLILCGSVLAARAAPARTAPART